MKWNCIRLTREECQSGELDVLIGAFREAYVASNGPAGMALFGSWSDDGLFYLIYVTPHSERYLRPILLAYSAKLEDFSPDRRGLSCLCGDQEALSALIC